MLILLVFDKTFECDSGGSKRTEKSQDNALTDAPLSKGVMDAVKLNVDSKIQTARERYLARKGGKS
jgi:hypothetical protein